MKLRKLLFVAALAVCLIAAFTVFGSAHTVDFDAEGAEPQEVADGDYASVPATPTKAGSIFLYWSTNGIESGRFRFSTPITGDLKLVPVWEEIIRTYTVTFLDHEGNAVSVQLVEEGEDALAPATAPAEVGRRFLGWDAETDNVTSDMTVNARYGEAVHTVTFLNPDRSFLSKTTVNHGENAVFPDNFVIPEGYTVIEYTSDGSNITSDITIRPLITPGRITVNFYSGEEALGNAIVTYGGSVQIPETPEKDGHIFLAWKTAAGDAFSFTTALTDAVVAKTAEGERSFALYADFEVIQKPRYTVTFLGENDEVISQQTVDEGKGAIEPSAPESATDGYTFSGWDTVFDSVTGTLTVRAQYTYTPPEVPTENEFVVTSVVSEEGIATVTVTLTGDTINASGFKGTIDLAGTQDATVTYWAGGIVVNTTATQLIFTCGKASNIKRELLVLTFTCLAAETSKFTLTMGEVVTIDENYDAVDAVFSVSYDLT